MHYLLPVAELMDIQPLDAVALPAVVLSFARRLDMTEAAVAAELMVNPELRDYAAQLCREAMAK